MATDLNWTAVFMLTGLMVIKIKSNRARAREMFG